MRPCHWMMMTGLMTTTARFGPIRGRFGRQSLFVNDVMSVKQNGVVLGINRCEWVYRRRSVPLSRLGCCPTAIPWENNLDDQISVSEASLERIACGSSRLSPATLRWQPGRRGADRQDGQRRVHLHHGEHGHDFGGIRRRIHFGRHRRWVVLSQLKVSSVVGS